MNRPVRQQRDWHNAKYATCDQCGSHRAVVDNICSECHEEDYRIEVEEYYLKLIENDNWVDINERLPEIPEGKYGVPVVIATWDGEYQEVTTCNYGKVTNRDDEYIDPTFEHLPIDSLEFMQMYISMKGPYGWMPIMDEITHWRYYPKAPKLERNNEN